MVNLKFGAFIFAVCLLLKSCVCETTNPCTIQDTIATCESNENFKSLQNETNISKLIVRSKELKRIDKEDLAAFVNLEEIDVSNCGLEEIDENAFAGLAKLHKINLAGNAQLKVPNEGFLASDTLTCLNLSNTVVEQLDKTFAHLPKLENLDLSGTNVKDFSPLKLQEHLTKLVVSKTNATKDLCSMLSIKEIIERDANGIETQLDCKPVKVEATNDLNKEEDKDQATGKIEEAQATANKTAVITVAPTVATKTEETTKAPEATTISTIKNDLKALESPAQNLTNKDDGAEHVHENSSNGTAALLPIPKEDKIDSLPPKEEHNNSDKETPVGAVSKDDKNEHPAENAEEKAITETKGKTEKPVEKVVLENTAENVENETTEHPTINTEDQADPKPEKKRAKIVNKEAPTDEKPQLNVESVEEILPSTADTSQSNGVNIVLGIILCVMVVGAAGFGYKYWKNRRSGYTHANTQDHDDEDKELQTIVAHRADPEQN